MRQPWYPAPVFRRCTASFVALCSAVATPAAAAAPAPENAPVNTSAAAETHGQALAKEGKFLEAAEALVQALQEVPSEAAHRSRRNQLAIEAVNAYKLAFDGDPSRCATIHAGLEVASKYLEDLQRTYGAAAMLADDYAGMAKSRTELEQARDAKQCATPEKPAPAPITPAAAPVAAPEPVVPEPVQQDVAPWQSHARAFGVGIGVSAGLAVGMAIGSGVMFTRLRQPDGPLYGDVREAAEMNGVPTNDSRKDMCDDVAGKTTLDDACGAWNAGRRGFLAMTVMAGVFVASAAVFTGLLIRDRRQQRSVAQAWRHHHVQIGAAPRSGGATVTAGFRF